MKKNTRKIKMVGRTFGDFEVVAEVEPYLCKTQRVRQFKVRCANCGFEKTIRGDTLRKGRGLRCTKCNLKRWRGDKLRCSKCEQFKDPSEFYVNRSTGAYQYYCRQCKQQWESEHREELNQRFYEKVKERNPQITKAYNAVQYALRTGELKRPITCQMCGGTCKPQAHHSDYNKPLDVQWLCIKCHRQLHRMLNKEANNEQL